MAGEVWVAPHDTDSWQTTGSGQRSVRFSLIRAEDIRSVSHQRRDHDGTSSAVIAMVSSPGTDARGTSTVLADHTAGSGEDSPLSLPPLFHLDLTRALGQARQLNDAEPLFVRAEYENGQWHWRVHTYEQLRERIELANLAAESL